MGVTHPAKRRTSAIITTAILCVCFITSVSPNFPFYDNHHVLDVMPARQILHVRVSRVKHYQAGCEVACVSALHYTHVTIFGIITTRVPSKAPLRAFCL